MSQFIEEFEWLMEIDETGIAVVSDADAMSSRIQEWFCTPQGTVADLPTWGHNLTQYKHEPLGSDLEVMVAMSITEKMPMDVKNLQMRNIAIEFQEIDFCYVVIDFAIGVFEGEVTI
jgi:phage baseplate assembly protein W